MARSDYGAEAKVMSSSKGSKRISVFDRLGPGNDDVMFNNSACMYVYNSINTA